LRLGTSFTSMAWTLARYNVLSTDAARALAALPPQQIKQQLLGESPLTNPKSDVWLLDEYDQDTIIEPHAHDTFLVTLRDNSTSGYVWDLDGLSSEGFNAKPVFNDAATVPVTRHFRPDSPVGSHVNASMIISRADGAAIDDGTLAMSLVQHRPWEEPSADNEHCRFRAEYEQLFFGVDKAERQRRMDDARAVA
jgi:hypothetical protein